MSPVALLLAQQMMSEVQQNFLMTGKSDGFNANTYVRMMPHTTAANIGIFFGLTGRIIPHLVLVLLAGARYWLCLSNQFNMV